MAESAYVQLVHVDPTEGTKTVLHVGWATITPKGYAFIVRPNFDLSKYPLDECKYQRLPTSGLHAFK